MHEGARWNPADSFICLFIFITHKRENSEKKENNRNQEVGALCKGAPIPLGHLGEGEGGALEAKKTTPVGQNQ